MDESVELKDWATKGGTKDTCKGVVAVQQIGICEIAPPVNEDIAWGPVTPEMRTKVKSWHWKLLFKVDVFI